MTSMPSSIHIQNCPAQLFLETWRELCLVDSTSRATSSPPKKEVQNLIKGILEEPNGEKIYIWLETVKMESMRPEEALGMRLYIMQAIDRMFYRIHPRAVFVQSGYARPIIPDWLESIKISRRKLGMYKNDGDFFLIPRGPLVREARDENASFSDSLADRFTALAVVSRQLTLQEGRPIRIVHKVISHDAISGVPVGITAGAEVVACIPIAELSVDLVANERTINNKIFVDYRLHPSLNAADKVFKALAQVDIPLDIAMAPELVVSELHADELANSFLARTDGKLRLIVAGSGQTSSLRGAQPWNEARILSGNGTELWRQRKILPAGITSATAIKYGLSDPGEGMSYEDTAAGTELVVADIYGLGRCVVLICQDFEARPMTDELIRTYQPDWIFIPILDPGIRIGNWAHQRAFELSSISQARFLIVSSTGLAHKINPESLIACGLAVGPKTTSGGDTTRAYFDAAIELGSSAGYALIKWRSPDGWCRTVLS